jgi:predicted transcriptional regulator
MKIKPTESELEILNILWTEGPRTVREIHEELEKSKSAGYTTTLKLMQIMHEKGMLTRDITSKTHIYKAAINQEQIQEQIVQRVIDTAFNGSAMHLVMQALGNNKTSKDELEQIKEYLEQIEKKTTDRK